MQESLLSELDKEIAKREKWSRSDFGLAQLVYCIGLTASALGVLAVAIGGTHPAVLACLAAIPGIVLMIDRTFQMQTRAKWNFTYRHRVVELRRRLLYEGAPCAEISRRFSQLDQSMEGIFPYTDRSTISSGNAENQGAEPPAN